VSIEDFETLPMSAGPLEAESAPGLGMAVVSLRHRGDELLDRGTGLRAYARTGAVMGVPLLYPWANRLAARDYLLDGHDVRLPSGPPLVHCEEHGLPIHGLLHASPHWCVTGHDERRIAARLDFDTPLELLAAFPFPHTLEIVASLPSERLRITTTVRPTTPQAVPIAFGFHPSAGCPASRAPRGR
jgi:galactose mutarotase-like enzyme